MRRRRKPKPKATLRGVQQDHRELAKQHFAEAITKMHEVERAAREGNCHKALQYLVGAGAEHGLARAHALEAQDKVLAQRSDGLAARLNLMVDTIGWQCTRPKR